jgi:hypothetical protein
VLVERTEQGRGVEPFLQFEANAHARG